MGLKDIKWSPKEGTTHYLWPFAAFAFILAVLYFGDKYVW